MFDPSRESPRPTWPEGVEGPNSHSHDIVQAVGWVDHELSNRLATIDRKLDHLTLQVSGYHAFVTSGLCVQPPAGDSGRLPLKAEEASDFEIRVNSPSKPVPFTAARVQDAWTSDARESGGTGTWVGAASDKQAKGSDDPAVSDAIVKTKSSDTGASKTGHLAGAKDEMEPAMVSVVSGALNAPAIKLRLLMDDPEYSRMAYWYSVTMPTFVVLSVIPAFAQGTVHPPFSDLAFGVLESCVEAIFILDVTLRLLTCAGPRAFVGNFHNIFDIIVPLPIIIRASYGFAPSWDDLQDGTKPASILLYIVPLLRLLKTLRGFRKFSLVVTVAIKVYVETLPTIFMLSYLVMIFATLFWYIEPRDNIESYSKAIWFVCVTMTTVGYGDLSPVTTPGYMLATLLVCSSVFVMAMPLGIIGSAVAEIWKDRDTIILRKWAKDRLDQWGYRAADIPEFFDAFDSDGSGELDFDEFCEMLAEMKVDIKTDRLRMLFKSFDDDDSGLVDAKEFVKKLYPEQFDDIYPHVIAAAKGSKEEKQGSENEPPEVAIANVAEPPSQPLRQVGQVDGNEAEVVKFVNH